MYKSSKNLLKFSCGAELKNRFMLAPMTNTQSHEDGKLSDDEYNWLVMRAKGGFGLTMTCASHVQAVGKGFPGQLGIFSDTHIDGHKRLVKGIKSHGSLAVIQLHHAGMRSPEDIIEGQPVSASDMKKYNARGLTLEEVHQLKDDFISAALRAQQCGYDGVEVHGAHGYILTQFLSSDINTRTDNYGGSLKNRARLLFDVTNGIRTACGPKFLLGVRLSPERFGMKLQEVKTVCQRFISEGQIDFLDISLWDCFKDPEENKYKDQSLLEHFTSLDYKHIKLTVAGNIRTGNDVTKILNAKVDFVSIGRAAILHHDFPEQVLANPNFKPTPTPVTEVYLKKEGLSDKFVTYMKRWPDFVVD
ncbi:NADH:flavin oxidoreductase [Psychroserpens ponticola]|uniref:NADH:flavin oxidoreductase n=1 Tax=Psychroserpens ponticola TaxID=2932268 RepID=A0ABY7RZ14_9FLAO|nr:NADH:flavin oxidoreductase [Psychroserpens ponticola]WCO02380.1 NADH:flavin oxidoreductase [Psychroserpens ponticola]